MSSNKKTEKKKKRSTGSIPDNTNGSRINQFPCPPAPAEMVTIRFSEQAARDSDLQDVIDSQQSQESDHRERFNLFSTPRSEELFEENSRANSDVLISEAEVVVDSTGNITDDFKNLLGDVPQGNHSLDDVNRMINQNAHGKGEKEKGTKFKIPRKPKESSSSFRQKHTKIGSPIPVITRQNTQSSSISSASTVPIIINPYPKMPPGYNHTSPQFPHQPKEGASRIPQNFGQNIPRAPPKVAADNNIPPTVDNEIPGLNDPNLWDRVSSVVDHDYDDDDVSSEEENESLPFSNEDFVGGEHARRYAGGQTTHRDSRGNLVFAPETVPQVGLRHGTTSGAPAFDIENRAEADLFDAEQLAALSSFPAAALAQLREVEVSSAVSERKSAQGKSINYSRLLG